jgi:hypothetical protein
MPIKPTPQKTLKQEKSWLIDEKKGEITYDVSNDVNDGWWERIGQSYGGTTQQINTQGGDFNRSSTGTGVKMTWFDHHAQAFNDAKRKHPQRDNNNDD